MGNDVGGQEEIVSQEEHSESTEVQTEVDGVKSEGAQLCRASESATEPMEDLLCKPCNPGGVEAAEADIEEEGERQRVLADPGQPTQDEIDEHEVAHFPFRPWYAACVKGRAQASPSRRITG